MNISDFLKMKLTIMILFFAFLTPLFGSLEGGEKNMVVAAIVFVYSCKIANPRKIVKYTEEVLSALKNNNVITADLASSFSISDGVAKMSVFNSTEGDLKFWVNELKKYDKKEVNNLIPKIAENGGKPTTKYGLEKKSLEDVIRETLKQKGLLKKQKAHA